MAGTKEIKRRLVSVKNTKKITYAMKLVSAAKLRRAQESVVKARDYTTILSDLLAELYGEIGGSDVVHPLMEVRSEVKNIRLLVIGGARGLCGGYNANINKRVEALIKELAVNNPNAKISAVVVGKKPAEYFRRTGKSYVSSYEALSEDANLWPIDDITRDVENDFLAGNIDEVYCIFTRFKSAISVFPTTEKLLPMTGDLPIGGGSSTKTTQASGITLFEPSVQGVFNAVMPRILRSKIRQASLDAKASEQGSRMTAMDAATKNAGELIQQLTLSYNKLRQSGITSELLDIIGGSEALQ